jgi:hypothetical protein
MMQHDHERAGTGSDTSGRTSETTRTQAQQAGNEARREARGVAEEAKGAAHDVMDEARATGSTLKQEAKGLTGSLKDGLSAQARAQGWLAGLMDRGAQELDSIADDIRRSDVSSLLDSVEVFARRQPALFMGASVALGFALSRVARSGGESRYGSYEDRSTYGRGDYGYGGADDYRPTASRTGGGYVDDRPERPDLGQAWPQAGTGHASPGMTTGTGAASPTTGLGVSAQPGYGGTGAGGSVGTTSSTTGTTGSSTTATGAGAAKNSGKTADEGTTRGSNV